MKIYLILNYGSSSLKACLYNQDFLLLNKYHITDFSLSNIDQVLEKLVSKINIEPEFFVHRVVHGMDYKSPFLINQKGLEVLRFLAEINPLHNSISLKGIEFFMKYFRNKIHYAVFDTDFHCTIPEYARIYGIDINFYQKGIKKYGFHGISYSYVLRKLSEFLNKKEINLIVLHLGSGCSICAIKEGKSIDTSMGFSPLEGLMMQNRPGDIDPGVVLYLLKKGYTDYDDLYFKAGFSSIAKVKNFVELEDRYLSQEKSAVLAMESFIYRIVKYIGFYYILLGDIEGIVFTGGIGENSSLIRKIICERINSIGINIDDHKNKNNDFIISGGNSRIPVYVVKTNEEEEMLRIVLEKPKHFV